MAVLLALAYVSSRPILIACMPRSTVATFREDNRPGRTAIPIRGDDIDEALWLGGRSGSPSLEDLTCDASITQDGRERAGRVHDRNLRGDHVKFLEYAFAELRHGPPPWPIPSLWRYIYERDRAFPPDPSVGPDSDPAPQAAGSR